MVTFKIFIPLRGMCMAQLSCREWELDNMKSRQRVLRYKPVFPRAISVAEARDTSDVVLLIICKQRWNTN